MIIWQYAISRFVADSLTLEGTRSSVFFFLEALGCSGVPNAAPRKLIGAAAGNLMRHLDNTKSCLYRSVTI